MQGYSDEQPTRQSLVKDHRVEHKLTEDNCALVPSYNYESLEKKADQVYRTMINSSFVEYESYRYYNLNEDPDC